MSKINLREALRPEGVYAHTFTGFDRSSIPFVVAASRHFDRAWRVCFVWHRQHDQRLRDNLLFCFKAWARTELPNSDLKRIKFFAVEVGDAGQISRFKVIGAHRELGHLFPVFFLPFAIGKMVKPAAKRLQQEISNRTIEAPDGEV